MNFPSILEFKDMYTQKDIKTLFAWFLVAMAPIIIYLVNPDKFTTLTIVFELPLLFIVISLRADFELFWDTYKPIVESLPNIANSLESNGEINESILIRFYPNSPPRYVKKCFRRLIKDHKLIFHNGKWHYPRSI
ncbi:MAG: hypothetical protein OEW15_18095 [Nitrospirota bacterium]|nr:hypothetical protein [Nitrospirota bacterium]